jgi:hypothetical protein
MVHNRFVSQIALYALFVLGLNGLFLFSPAPQEPFYGYWIAWGSHLGLPRNYDSEEFSQLAAQPAGLLALESKRQSRPLSVWLASAMAYPFGEWRWREFSAYDVAYVLQNWVLLTGSMLLFARLCHLQAVPAWVMWGLAVPLVCNDLTKAFFWNNHQQMFAVFAPLFLIWMCIVLWEDLSVARCVGFAVSTGVLFLGYGTWMLVLPLMVGIVLVQSRRGTITRGQSAACLSAAVLFGIPILGWVGFVMLRNGSFYSAEVSLVHQFVWLRDALAQGAAHAVRECADYAWQFGRTFRSWEVLPFVMLGTLVVIWHRKRLSNVAIASMVVGALFAIFLYLMGYYRNRLTFSLVPPLLVCIAPYVGSWKYSPVGLLLFDLAWVAYHVLKHGPYD